MHICAYILVKHIYVIYFLYIWLHKAIYIHVFMIMHPRSKCMVKTTYKCSGSWCMLYLADKAME